MACSTLGTGKTRPRNQITTPLVHAAQRILVQRTILGPQGDCIFWPHWVIRSSYWRTSPMHHTRLQAQRPPCCMECPIRCRIRPCMDDPPYVPQPSPRKCQKHGFRKRDRGQIHSSHLVPRHNSHQGNSTKFRTRDTRTHAWPAAQD